MLCLLEKADRCRFEFVVACAEEEGEFRAALEAIGVRVVPVPFNVAGADPTAEGKIYRQPLRLLKYVPHVLRSVRLLRALIRAEDVDLLYANSFKAGALLSCVRTKNSPPLVVRLRSSRSFLSHGWIDRLICSRADVLLANSRYVAATFEPIVRDAAKIHVLYNCGGITENQRNSKDADRVHLRKLLDTGENTIVIGQVGRLTPRKRVADVVRSLPYLSDRLGEWMCVFIGSYEDTSQSRAIHEEALTVARELGVGDRVVFTGHRDDVLSLTSGLDVMVLASQDEPMARVIIEALGLGTPIVASAHGGNAEIIDDGVNGRAFALGDHIGLARAITEVVSDPNLRSRLVSNGYDTYRKYFSEQATVEAEEALLSKVAQRDL